MLHVVAHRRPFGEPRRLCAQACHVCPSTTLHNVALRKNLPRRASICCPRRICAPSTCCPNWWKRASHVVQDRGSHEVARVRVRTVTQTLPRRTRSRMAERAAEALLQGRAGTEDEHRTLAGRSPAGSPRGGTYLENQRDSDIMSYGREQPRRVRGSRDVGEERRRHRQTERPLAPGDVLEFWTNRVALHTRSTGCLSTSGQCSRMA